MARNTATDQRDQQANRTNKNTSQASGARSQTNTSTRSDQERSIQTNREQPSRGQAGLSRRHTGPVSDIAGSNTSPFSLVRRMAEDMDRLFSDFAFGRSGVGLAPFWEGASDFARTTWSPQVETFRRGDKLVVRADLPGLKKEDVNVEVDDGMLTISGERSEEHEDNRDDYYRSERSYGQFFRSIPLPEDVTGEQCDATFKDGVLEVTLPAPKQTAASKSRRIPIR